MSKRQILYAAVYENAATALAGLDPIEQLHENELEAMPMLLGLGHR